MLRKITVLISLLMMLGVLGGCSRSEEKGNCVVCGQLTADTLAGGKMMLESMGIPDSKMEHMGYTVYSIYVCDSCRGSLKTTLF